MIHYPLRRQRQLGIRDRYKYGELAVRGDVIPDLTLVIENLPHECTFKALKTFAIEADTAPLWAVVFRSHGHRRAWIQDSPRCQNGRI